MLLVNGLNGVRENRVISAFAGAFRRHPAQQNALQECDSEVIRLDSGAVMAFDIDSVGEELDRGIFREAYTAGWVSVTAALSDIAAAGTKPVGIVAAVTLNPAFGPERAASLAQGMSASAQENGTYLLGGDTNSGSNESVTVCAIAEAQDGLFMKRTGIKPGHLIFATGKFGNGNCLAAANLNNVPEAHWIERSFRPVARVREGLAAVRFAAACMDTSDGLLACLDQLMRINGCGFEVEYSAELILAAGAREFARVSGIPPWLFTAGPVGEYELVMAVPPERAHEAAMAGFILLGRAIEEPEVRLNLRSGSRVALDTAYIRDIHEAQNAQQELMKLSAAYGLDRE